MKEFELTKKMVSMGGAFYPTGYAFIMFPAAADAKQAASALEAADDEIMYLTPQDVLQKIAHADGDSSVPMPSVGTEGATVQKYAHLARAGHHAIMVRVDSQDKTDHVMTVVRALPFSYAQKYHMLAIEDLE